MPEGNRTLSFTLEIDPQSKQVVVKGVREVGEAAADAVTKPFTKARKSFADIFSAGALLRITAAGYALKRIASAADEPSAKLRAFKGDVSDLAGVMGTELQAAAGAVLSTAQPLIRFFTEAGGGARGLLLGLAGIVSIGPPLVRVFTMLGAASGPAMWAVAAGMLAIGAAIGAIGKAAAANEEKLRGFTDQMTELPLDEKQQQFADLSRTIADLRKEIEELEDLPTVALSGFGGDFQTLDPRKSARLESARKQLAVAEQEADILTDLIDLDVKRQSQAIELKQTASDIVQELNLQIAFGKTTLEQARDRVKAAKTTAQTELDALKQLTDKDKVLRDSRYEEYVLQLKTADASQRESIEKAAIAKFTADIREAQGEVNTLEQTHLDLTRRITEQRAKERSEAIHRYTLIAKNLDIVRQEGPIQELLLKQALYKQMLLDGHLKTEIQMLELTLDIQQLEEAVTTAKKQQADEAKRIRSAEQQRLDDMAKFLSLVDLTVLKLKSVNDDAFRQRRLADLQKEIGLSDLTEQAIRRKAEAIATAISLTREDDTVTRKALEAQRDGLMEILGLLEQGRSKASEIPIEIALIGQAMQNAAAQGTRSLVQMFTRGKIEAKQFADAMRNIFEELISQLMARGILLMLASLIPGFGPAFGIVGAATGQGGSGARGMLPGGTTPFLPTPQRYLGGTDMSGWMQRMERSQRNLSRNIQRIAETPTEVVGVTLNGEVLRFAVQRAEAGAAKRRM